MLNFASYVVPKGRLHFWALLRLQNAIIKASKQGRFSLILDAREELQWWLHNCRQSSSIHHPPPQSFSDDRLVGSGLRSTTRQCSHIGAMDGSGKAVALQFQGNACSNKSPRTVRSDAESVHDTSTMRQSDGGFLSQERGWHKIFAPNGPNCQVVSVTKFASNRTDHATHSRHIQCSCRLSVPSPTFGMASLTPSKYF